MKKKIFLISGKARHGKGETSRIIREKLEDNSIELNYGDFLKFIAARYFDWDGEKDEKGRTLLQYLGTDVCRTNYENIWVDIVMILIQALRSEFDIFTIADTRFKNEIDYRLQDEFDIITVRVIRTEFESPLTEEQQMHPSEVDLDDYKFDFVLTAKNILELELEVERMLNVIK